MFKCNPIHVAVICIGAAVMAACQASNPVADATKSVASAVANANTSSPASTPAASAAPGTTTALTTATGTTVSNEEFGKEYLKMHHYRTGLVRTLTTTGSMSMTTKQEVLSVDGDKVKTRNTLTSVGAAPLVQEREESLKALADSATPKSSSDSKVTYSLSYLGTESVTVPAGTFSAKKYLLKQADSSLPSSSEGTYWLADGPGIVKIISTQVLGKTPLTTTTELTEFKG